MRKTRAGGLARKRQTLFEPLTWRRVLLYVLAAAAVGAVLYLLALAWQIEQRGLSWRQMDWNGDGRTTLGEFFHTADVGTRGVQRGGRLCTEYFELKDGLPIRVVCPGE